jgi:uncharacterized protein (DUF4415 family)
VARQIDTLRDEYDVSKAKRGAVISSPGKTHITIMLDDDVIEYFRAKADSQGIGYQTLINARLRKAVMGPRKSKADDKPLTVATLRRVLREELQTP